MILNSRTERYETDCSVFHGDACIGVHGKPKWATPVMLWRKAKREFPGLPRIQVARCVDLMVDHGMLR